MKKALVVALVVILLTLGLLVGCGPVRTQTYDFTDFTRVEIGYAFHVEVVQSNSYSISITASENLFNLIQVSKEGETLKIGLTQPVAGTRRAEITMPNLRAIKLSGATKGSINGFSSSNDFSLDLSGASSLNGDLTAGDVNINVSGASTLKLDGSASDMVANVSGASRFNLGSYEVNNADVTLGGASSGTVNLDGRLDANLSGASKLSYIGEPTMGNINTSGASTLSKK
jgi:hypothetical protein